MEIGVPDIPKRINSVPKLILNLPDTLYNHAVYDPS